MSLLHTNQTSEKLSTFIQHFNICAAVAAVSFIATANHYEEAINPFLKQQTLQETTISIASIELAFSNSTNNATQEGEIYLSIFAYPDIPKPTRYKYTPDAKSKAVIEALGCDSKEFYYQDISKKPKLISGRTYNAFLFRDNIFVPRQCELEIRGTAQEYN